jgi:hypothetical protein
MYYVVYLSDNCCLTMYSNNQFSLCWSWHIVCFDSIDKEL